MGDIKEETAIAPEFNLDAMNKAVAPKTLDKEEIKEDTSGEDLASLKHNKGYQELEQYIVGRLKEFGRIDIENSTPEMIGYNYALNEGKKVELENILTIVDSNYEFQKERKEGGTDTIDGA